MKSESLEEVYFVEYGNLYVDAPVVHTCDGCNPRRAGAGSAFGFSVIFIKSRRMHFPEDSRTLR